MLIRFMTEIDFPAFSTIIARVKSTEFGAKEPFDALLESTREDLKESFHEPGSRYLIAEHGGRVVGGAGILPVEDIRGNICELDSVFLLPEARRLGTGHALVLECLKLAREAGYDRCYLDTMMRMTAARALYAKCGFVELPAPLRDDTPDYCNCWMLCEL